MERIEEINQQIFASLTELNIIEQTISRLRNEAFGILQKEIKVSMALKNSSPSSDSG